MAMKKTGNLIEEIKENSGRGRIIEAKHKYGWMWSTESETPGFSLPCPLCQMASKPKGLL